MNMKAEQPKTEIMNANKNTEGNKPKTRSRLFRKKDMTPDTFDFSISENNSDKRIILRIAERNKEMTLCMDQDAVITLMTGLMETATDMLDIQPDDKMTRDVMYA